MYKAIIQLSADAIIIASDFYWGNDRAFIVLPNIRLKYCLALVPALLDKFDVTV